MKNILGKLLENSRNFDHVECEILMFEVIQGFFLALGQTNSLDFESFKCNFFELLILDLKKIILEN